MPNNKNDNLDEFFDNLFSQLDNDDDNVVNTTIADFGKVIKNEVDNSAKKNGYDTIEDMLSHKMSGKTYSRPEVKETKYGVPGNDRYSYFVNLLDNVTYAQSYRGYYMEGHQRMIDMFKEKAKFCQENLSKLDSDIREERRRYASSKKDSYTKGCLDGIDYVEKALKKSKLYMMTRIKEELAYRK